MRAPRAPCGPPAAPPAARRPPPAASDCPGALVRVQRAALSERCRRGRSGGLRPGMAHPWGDDEWSQQQQQQRSFIDHVRTPARARRTAGRTARRGLGLCLSPGGLPRAAARAGEWDAAAGSAPGRIWHARGPPPWGCGALAGRRRATGPPGTHPRSRCGCSVRVGFGGSAAGPGGPAQGARLLRAGLPGGLAPRPLCRGPAISRCLPATGWKFPCLDCASCD